MNKLTKILQLAESFYRNALQSLAAEPGVYKFEDAEAEQEDEVVGSTSYDTLEEIWDQIDNSQLADKIRRFLDSYSLYSQALNSPKKSTVEEDSFFDLGNTLNDRWQRILNDEYLNLNEDDSKYTEVYPPDQIVDAVQNLMDDANRQKDIKAESLGFSAEEMEAIQNNVKKEMGIPQAAKDVENKLEGNVKQQFDNKVKKQLEYQQRFRNKLKTIGKLGVDNLAQKRQELAAKIEASNNFEERKEMEMRLKNMPDPQLLVTHQIGRKRRHEKMVADPARKANHDEQLKKRQALIRNNDAKRMELIDRYQAATNPSEKARLMSEMVKLEEAILHRNSSINMDDEFVRQSPDTIQLLNPEEIVKRNLQRRNKLQSHKNKEVAKRQQLRGEGNVVGLVLSLSGALASKINDLKKPIKKKIEAQGFTDPVFAEHLKAVSEAAKDPNNKAALDAAQLAMSQAVKTYVEQHPIIIEANRKLEPWVKLKSELQEVSSSKRKTSTPKNPWFHADILPEDKKPIVEQLASRCQAGATALQPWSPAIAGLFSSIAAKLKEKL